MFSSSTKQFTGQPDDFTSEDEVNQAERTVFMDQLLVLQARNEELLKKFSSEAVQKKLEGAASVSVTPTYIQGDE